MFREASEKITTMEMKRGQAGAACADKGFICQPLMRGQGKRREAKEEGIPES